MRNAQNTKDLIIKESANLFNTKGYKATSISDITKATGLTKGAIYRHFKNKDDLEKQALQRLRKVMFHTLGASIRKATNFKLKMEATFSFFETYMDTPLYKGGCPLMNVAIEVDDTNENLRELANDMLSQLKTSLERIIQNGIQNGQVLPTADPKFYSTVFIATLEGGIMMSKLEGNKNAILQTIKHLRMVTQQILK